MAVPWRDGVCGGGPAVLGLDPLAMMACGQGGVGEDEEGSLSVELSEPEIGVEADPLMSVPPLPAGQGRGVVQGPGRQGTLLLQRENKPTQCDLLNAS